LKWVDDFWISVRTMVIIFLSVITSVAMAQENQAGSETIHEQEKNPLNTVTLGIGRANNITEGVKFSNIGFDYLRRINPKWELGLQLDLEWEKNYVNFVGVATAAIVAYSVTQKWPVFAGFGMAFEEEHNQGFFRVGTEYTFFIGEKEMFFIAPGTFIDINADEVTPSVMMALGINW